MQRDGRLQDAAPTVALFPWGNVLEDFLDPLGVSLDTFIESFRGSWIFGYAAALERAGMRPVLLYTSRQVRTPRRVTHKPTGTVMHLLPAPLVYRLIARRMVYPYGQTVTEMFGDIRGVRRLLLPFYTLAKELALYSATPPIALERALRSEHCRTLVCQEYEYPRFDVCVLLGRLTRRKVFGCFQGGNYRHGRLEGVVRPYSIQASTGLIVGAQTEVERILSVYGLHARRVARIANPVDTDLWRPEDKNRARDELELPRDAAVAVWHGRVAIDKKGLDLLLDAWAEVRTKRAGRDARLLLIGTGDDAAKLADRLQTSGSEDVCWIDRFLNDEATVRRYLSAGDVYVFPSRYEGFPVAPLEAMACGLPLVATDVQGMREVLPDGEDSGGLLVPREDVAALATELSALLDDGPRRDRLGRAARQRVESAFSLDATGEQLRSLFGAAP
jgi:starch synthase